MEGPAGLCGRERSRELITITILYGKGQMDSGKVLD